MNLESANTISVSNALESDINQAFADDQARGNFIILSDAEQVYIQAAGEADGPYVVEYREGGRGRHFQSLLKMNRAEVLAIFQKYHRRDSTWKTDIPWIKLSF